jgi:hypothetical protein
VLDTELLKSSCGPWGNKHHMRVFGIAALGAALAGCASSSAEITPSYVSPVAYQGYQPPGTSV